MRLLFACVDMRQEPTTLILGAGSSCAFGFPTGEGLRQLIISYRDRRDVCTHIGFGRDVVRRFIDSFSRSQLNSIDAFLGRNVADAEVGKGLVAFALLERENEAKLFEDIGDHWYRYMLNELVNSVSVWEDLDLSWLSVVTFNYERSLEHFLTVSLGEIFDRGPDEVASKLKQLQIVHVYGSLGALHGDDVDPTPFGGIATDQLELFVRRGAKGIQVVPEGRVDSPSFRQARELLGSAGAIYFLGFGFDAVNIERLGGPETFANNPQRAKNIFSTTYGMTAPEVNVACQRVAGLGNELPLMKTRAISANCLQLLRETLPFTPL